MVQPIRVLVCHPISWEGRSQADTERDAALLRALDDRIEITFEPYLESDALRGLRGHPPYDEARRLASALTPAQAAAFAQAEIVLAFDLPFDIDRHAPGLKWVHAMASGVGQLQSAGLEKTDALLTNSAGIVAAPIAEFVLARILAAWKRFPALEQMQRDRLWTRNHGRSLAGSTIGIVGYGAIGSAVAGRAKALGMRVVATRRNLPPGDPAVDRFYPVSALAALLAESDAVVLCAPETPETFHLFDRDAFAAMKPGSYFCNVARGSLVDEPALIAALESGHLSGAAIDVAQTEPLPPEDPLWRAPNLAISPHSAAALEDYFTLVWRLFRENMRRYLAGEALMNRCPPGFTA